MKSIIEKIYKEHRRLERELFLLREENERLRRECQQLWEQNREMTTC